MMVMPMAVGVVMMMAAMAVVVPVSAVVVVRRRHGLVGDGMRMQWRWAHGNVNPAPRSSSAVAIRGRPINAVGSRLCTSAQRLMPSPSILALPAQS